MKHAQTWEEAERLLMAFFPQKVVEWKPQVVTKDGQKALAVPYIGTEAVVRRLNEALGMAGWSDDYTPLEGGAVMCRLSVTVDGVSVTKVDIGSAPKELPDPGNTMKSAYSNALKRTAIKFGIGDYLKDVPQLWVPYDSQRKGFQSYPRLPDQFLPESERGRQRQDRTAPPPQQQAPAPAAPPAAKPVEANGKAAPSGSAFRAKLVLKDSALAKERLIKPGVLLHFCQSESKAAGWEKEFNGEDTWPKQLTELVTAIIRQAENGDLKNLTPAHLGDAA